MSALAAVDPDPAIAQADVQPGPVLSPPTPRPAAKGPTLSLSLAEAVFLGLRDNRTVKSAYIERVAQKFDLFVAQARFRPTAIFNASSQATFPGSTVSLTPTASWLTLLGTQFQFAWARIDTRLNGVTTKTSSATLNVTQPLLRGAGWDVNTAPVKLAQIQENIARLALKSTVVNTVTQIIAAYRTLLLNQNQVSISSAALERAKAQLKSNQALVAAGRLAAAELVQTEAEIATQQVALLQTEQARNSAKIALLQLLAIDPHTDVFASDPLTAQKVDIDVEDSMTTALNSRMDYLSLEETVAAARQSLLVAKKRALGSFRNREFPASDAIGRSPTGHGLNHRNAGIDRRFTGR